MRHDCNNYVFVFVFDYDSISLVHVNPDLICKDLSNLTDSNGTRITDCLVANAKAGGGVLSYQ